MRRPILAANWKMHKNLAEAEAFVAGFLPLVADAGEVDIVIAPPFTSLALVADRLARSNVAAAAQNVNPEARGAFTPQSLR
jgi:triosephosphate isomerase